MPTPLQPSFNGPSGGHSAYPVRSMVITGLAAVALGAAAVATPFVASSISPAPVAAPALLSASHAATGSLGKALERSSVRPEVVNALTDAIQQNAEDQDGLAGKGFQALENFRPGIIHSFLNERVGDYADALQPLWDSYQAAGAQGGFGAYLASKPQEASDALIGVSDRLADSTDSGTLRMIYRMARPDAQTEVTNALPQIGSIMEKYSS